MKVLQKARSSGVDGGSGCVGFRVNRAQSLNGLGFMGLGDRG